MPYLGRLLRAWRDPRGREVRLYEADWQGHVLVFHTVMRDQEGWVQQAIERPDEIYRDADRRGRECYYRSGLLSRRPSLLTKVVVEALGRARGRVVTAYLTDKVKAGETKLWP